MKFRDANLQVHEKNSFTNPPLCVLPSYSQNKSRLLLPKRLWKCEQDYKNILLITLCFDTYFFYKNLIVLHHDGKSFLFWHLCQIHTFNKNLNDEEMTTSYLMCVLKQPFYNKNIMFERQNNNKRKTFAKNVTWQNIPTKKLKRTKRKKNRNYLSLVNLSLRCSFSELSAHRCFSK